MSMFEKPQIIVHIQKGLNDTVFDCKWVPCSAKFVWDPRQKDDPVANMEPAQGENKRDCWTVAFGNAYNREERVVCAGYDNGDIKLFDLRNMLLRWETNIKNVVCSLEFDRKDISMNKLVSTSLEGKFHVFDMECSILPKALLPLRKRPINPPYGKFDTCLGTESSF
ncbi:WD repeat-containing protein 92 [Cricetulus griseus]|uniref:WD repeat-containing protein 92 n=1 Tax=Cricetulus griseus TaxID=10029 RepID=G3GSU7_CRIGR|nr:WD repeat-containing protein 92 [Cricetulus griseus]